MKAGGLWTVDYTSGQWSVVEGGDLKTEIRGQTSEVSGKNKENRGRTSEAGSRWEGRQT